MRAIDPGIIYVFAVLLAASIGAVVLASKRHKQLVEQGLPDAEEKPCHEVTRNLERFRLFWGRRIDRAWNVTNAYTLTNGHEDDAIFLAGTRNSRVLGLCLHDPSIPVAPVCIAGEPGGWLAAGPFRYELLDRWPWSGGDKSIELLASRHRDDTTTSAEHARAWVDAAFTACDACDLPRPRFVEFADASVLFVFDLYKTHEHLDRVANLHAMVREAGGVGSLAQG